ncbi:MAG: 4Fe-4S binding protein [Elusimicrobia bacterium]|nr:4Fe-4S binding protein [Elusimicrobiota bacterium]MBD3411926.1 4Fe-4S binding protein [Elusimicrobiota bacterium]
MKLLILARRISQVSFFALFIYILWSTTYPLTGNIPTSTFFIADPLIMVMTSIAERTLLTGIVVSLLLLVATAILGRFFCGWICPLGSSIDCIGMLRKKHSFHHGARFTKIRYIKYGILGLIMVCALLGIQYAWIFDPLVIMGRFVSLNLIPTVTLIIDTAFIKLIQSGDLYNHPIVDFYRMLKSSFLGIKPLYFSNSVLIFVFFLMVLIPALLIKRFWCRAICPLGALYASVSRFSLLKRHVSDCPACGTCVSDCRMGAIYSDRSYNKKECILCMDCVYDCPASATSFRFNIPAVLRRSQKNTQHNASYAISRRQFFFLNTVWLLFGARRVRNRMRRRGQTSDLVIRPPGSLKEPTFINRCIRCGNCMKVCITNGLQPVILEAGITGIWTPQLIPEIGYCEYNCTLCGSVCPTGAIPALSLEHKQQQRLGLAVINHQICLPWAEGKECIVCEEHCPVHTKAIKLKPEKTVTGTLYKPVIDQSLCIGCGICQNKCPTRPERAIHVIPIKDERLPTSSSG